jgi:putative transposase
MKRVEIQLTDQERRHLETISSTGSSLARTIQRAQVLLALDRGIADQTIAEVLNLDRTRIWRLRKRYVEQGLEAALYDQPRSGRPTEYDEQAEAEIVALACSEPPKGYGCWSVTLLTEVARRQCRLLQSVSQTTVRQVLKKNGVSLG